jgi:3'-phosphoadenosine 5'-phosphosulfate sulfotransferase (PAPS reductase)/FAD synthetase
MDKTNPYRIKETTVISFSGGRTSAMMLRKVLEANDGLPSESHVLFANTGKEMPQTLDFVQRCSDEWAVPITWLEYGGRSPRDDDGEKTLYDYSFNVVDYKSASRNGEPFSRLMRDVDGIPNALARWCSGQLKARTIMRYLKSIGAEFPITSFIGLRGDEPRRAAKLHGKVSDGQDIFCPMFVAKETKETVSAFWRSQDFDLELPNNNGVTDWGNCDLCFLKGQGKKLSIIRERPELADWWIGVEKEHGDVFDRTKGSYSDLKYLATDSLSLFEFEDDHTIPCFCGD